MTEEGTMVRQLTPDEAKAITTRIKSTTEMLWELLLEAYAKRGDTVATDEAQLVEQLGHAVSVVEGSPMNIKITTGHDFRMAKSLIDALPKKAIRALHPFADEDPLAL